MIKTDKATPFQLGFQNIRAQTCGVNFSIHRLATDTDLSNQMKWFRNSRIREKHMPYTVEKDRTYSDIRMRGLYRQRTFGGRDFRDRDEVSIVSGKNNDDDDVFAVAGTKMEVFGEKPPKSMLWSQDISRSLPSVAECFTPLGMPVRPPVKRTVQIRKSYTTLGMTGQENKQKELKKGKLPKLIGDVHSTLEREKSFAKHPLGELRQHDDHPQTERSRNNENKHTNVQNIPKILSEVQSARESNRKNEARLPVEPLPFIFTPQTAPSPYTFTPANTLASSGTPESRSKSRRAPIPFRNVAHKTFLD